jgi:hypothetical protein
VKLAWSNARALTTGVALVVLINAIALAGVAYNRSGDPQATLRLTERELQIPYWSWPDNENSGIDLRLRWRVHDAESSAWTWNRSAGWLTADKLRSLGFDLETATIDFELDSGTTADPSRDVFLVLEYDGAAYQAALEHSRKLLEIALAESDASADEAAADPRLRLLRERVESEERSESRLFVIDAGLDPEALRQRYAQRDKYAIVAGRIELAFASLGRSTVSGWIAGPNVETIRVPHAHRAIVEPFAANRTYENPKDPRFAATVAFGQRFEPWIVDLTKM